MGGGDLAGPRPESWLHGLWSLANTVTFGMRNLVRWRVPIVVDRLAPDEPLFPYLVDPADALATVRAWEIRYGIDARGLAPHTETVRHALYILGMLEAALDDSGVRLPHRLEVLDIGAKNWHYVRALWALLERHCAPSDRVPGLIGEEGRPEFGFAGRPDVGRQVKLTGIEIDPFVVYRDGHSRHDWARHYARHLPSATYLAGDALEHQGAYDLVLLLFPLMLEAEHLDWGLPIGKYRPTALLKRARELTRPGGTLIVTCYDYEQQDLLATCRALGLEPDVARPHRSDVADYDIGRFVTVFKR